MNTTPSGVSGDSRTLKTVSPAVLVMRTCSFSSTPISIMSIGLRKQ